MIPCNLSKSGSSGFTSENQKLNRSRVADLDYYSRSVTSGFTLHQQTTKQTKQPTHVKFELEHPEVPDLPQSTTNHTTNSKPQRNLHVFVNPELPDLL